MARFKGKPKFIGTRGDVTVYSLYGKFYCRSKSSLSGERVKTDKAFSRTMENAGKLARASKIASKIYKALPPGKNHSDYRSITGRVMKMLGAGVCEERIVKFLLDVYNCSHI